MSVDDLLNTSLRNSAPPYALLEYQRFLENSRPEVADAYLFFESKVRFTLEPDDVLVTVNPISTGTQEGRTMLTHEPTGTSVRLPTLDSATAQRIVRAIRPDRPLIAVQFAAECHPEQLDEFVKATLGRLSFVPRTIERFESRVSGTELIRFVGSPYEIQREYWSNMGDCRERILGQLVNCSELDAWFDELANIHVIALLGADGRSFYRPQSPLGQRHARPGALYLTASRRIEESGVTWFIDGPRISAPFVGGRPYHELLYRSVNDAGALLTARAIVDREGTDWGNVAFGRARRDVETAAWFCPPRPIQRPHVVGLFESFRRGLAAALSPLERLHALADFHWRFVRLHPFRCANQSVSMNIVNALRLRAELAPIPHLILDQLALRLTNQAYRRVFQRAMTYWAESDVSPAERWRKLAERRMHLDRFVGHAGAGDADAHPDQWLKRDPAGASLALLLD